MLSMIFGQSKYYTDALSVNTKRGFKQKCLRGEYPTRAPFGYINDARYKTIKQDRNIAPHIKSAFELYAKGNSTLGDISDFLYSHNVTTTLSKKKIERTRIHHMLSNSFYMGLFKYSNEIYQGNHKPIVSKQLFDKVQDVLSGKSKKKVHALKTVAPYGNGLIKCASCNMSVYAETHSKVQKNGNVHHWTYYRCTHKNKNVKCT
jgi:hypothetical protein